MRGNTEARRHGEHLIDEDADGGALCFHQREAARRNAVLEEPLAPAEHHGTDPRAVLVDEVGGDQGLQ
jgi:hypothetical protein